MLTALDESLLHQSAETFDNTSISDHRFFDRTVIGMHSPDGAHALVSCFAVYKNTNVMDGFFCVQENSRRRQLNQRLSRTLRPNVDDVRLGPLKLEVLEPLKKLRLSLEPGKHPCSCDITWTAALPPYEEAKHFTRLAGRTVRDHIRFDQLARASGWINIEGERTEFKDWFAWRDHSWGVRPDVGGFEPYNGRDETPAGFLGLYCWWLTEESGGFVQLHEDGDGQRLFMDGHIDFQAAPGQRCLKVADIRHDVSFAPGTRVFDRAIVDVGTTDGQTFHIEAESIGRPWVYKGTGYSRGYNDEKGLGVWRGEWLEEIDVYDTGDPEAVILPNKTIIRPVHREQIARVTVNGQPGFAHFPMINWGPIKRYRLGLDDAERALDQLNG